MITFYKEKTAQLVSLLLCIKLKKKIIIIIIIINNKTKKTITRKKLIGPSLKICFLMPKRNANKTVHIVTGCIFTTIPKARPSTLYPNVFNSFLFKQTQLIVKEVYTQVQRAWCFNTDAEDETKQIITDTPAICVTLFL